MTTPGSDRVQVHELRVVAEAVARDFAALAETLTATGELAVTGRRMTELGTTLRTFGELYERYFTQDLSQGPWQARVCVEFRADVAGDLLTCMRCRHHRDEHGRGVRRT